MKRLCNATNLPDAHLVADMLASNGIRVRIFNQNAAGALGELPFDAAAPQVWLEEAVDEPRARALLDEYRREATGSPRRCPLCGEENPPAFDLCWSCGKSLPV